MPSALETATRMYSQGALDEEIVRALQEDGVPPSEINDALNQAKIKQAVSEPQESVPQSMQMQPSIMQAPEESEMPVPIPIKKQKQQQGFSTPYSPYPAQEQAYSPYASADYSQYPATQEQGYNQYQSYSGGGMDAETIEEIAEEITAEKIKEFKMQVGDIGEFKQDTDATIAVMNDRIKRIESAMDKLQAALLGKVNDYGKDIKDLGGEMRALETAFSTILNPLVDNVKDLSAITDRLKQIRGAGAKFETASRDGEKVKEEIKKIKEIEPGEIIQFERKVRHRHHKIKKPIKANKPKIKKHKLIHPKIVHKKIENPLKKVKKHTKKKPEVKKTEIKHVVHKIHKPETKKIEIKHVIHKTHKPEIKEHPIKHLLPAIPSHPLSIKTEHKEVKKENKPKKIQKKKVKIVKEEVTKKKTIINK